jgi:hypothetical protein
LKKNILWAGSGLILRKMSKGNTCSVDLLLKAAESSSVSHPEGFDVHMWVRCEITEVRNLITD